jgi:hypothetical protein
VLWPACEPFLSHLLLQLDSSGADPAAAAATAALLQAQLARLAGSQLAAGSEEAGGSSAAAGSCVLAFLLRQLHLLPTRTAELRCGPLAGVTCPACLAGCLPACRHRTKPDCNGTLCTSALPPLLSLAS